MASEKKKERQHSTGSWGCTLSGLAFLGGLFTALHSSAAVGIPICIVAAFFGWRSERKVSAIAKAHNAHMENAGPLVGDAWRRLFESEGLADVIPNVEPLVRDALRVATRRVESVPRGASRVGGLPDLPPGIAWPRCSDEPMAFLAQFNLEEVARALPARSPLPAKGHLWFFFDLKGWPSGDRPSDAKGSVVLYDSDEASVEPAAAPADLSKRSRFPLCETSFEWFEDIPDLTNEREIDKLLEENYRSESYDEISAHLAAGAQRDSHKLLGFANPVQDVMELDCQLVTNGITFGQRRKEAARVQDLAPGAREWRLLLQVESDGNAGMMWGDAGCLYFWIRDEDLRAAKFDRTWTIFQCS